jgi:hypothetical protein
MTEAEWLACADPQPMLEFLRGKASDRKVRLFACACCRRIWHLLPDERSRQAVEVAEEYAEGGIEAHTIRDAWDAEGVTAIGHALDGATALDAAWGADWTAKNVADAVREIVGRERTKAVIERMVNGSAPLSDAEHNVQREREESSYRSERKAQSSALRDLIGNPFCPLTVDPTWLAWNNGAIPMLARTIYDDRAFDRLPLLADGLVAAGCTNEDILAHGRSGGEHVRGCWVVDLVLGKT